MWRKRWCYQEYWRRKSENELEQLSGRQGIIDLSGDYRLWLWNPLFSNKIILKALELLSVMLLIAQKVVLVPDKPLLGFHNCN